MGERLCASHFGDLRRREHREHGHLEGNLGVSWSVESFSYFALPNVTIEPSRSVDKQQKFSTLFVIRNIGNVLSAYDVGFGCAVTGRFVGPGFLGFDKDQLKPLPSLSAGGSVTRSCIPKSSGLERDDSLDIFVIYRLPFFPWNKTVQGHFIVKRDSDSFFFVVPDNR
jgi:hypothetical protein